MSAGISRRTFFGLAAGAAAVHALPASVVGLAVEPAGVAILSANYRFNTALTLIDSYMRYHGTQYRFTRYLSDTGTVLAEDVRALQPYEELTIALLDRTQR